LFPREKLRGFQGRWLVDMDFGVVVKLVATSVWVFPEELFSAKHSLGVTVAHTFAHRDAVAWLIQ